VNKAAIRPGYRRVARLLTFSRLLFALTFLLLCVLLVLLVALRVRPNRDVWLAYIGVWQDSSFEDDQMLGVAQLGKRDFTIWTFDLESEEFRCLASERRRMPHLYPGSARDDLAWRERERQWWKPLLRGKKPTVAETPLRIKEYVLKADTNAPCLIMDDDGEDNIMDDDGEDNWCTVKRVLTFEGRAYLLVYRFEPYSDYILWDMAADCDETNLWTLHPAQPETIEEADVPVLGGFPSRDFPWRVSRPLGRRRDQFIVAESQSRMVEGQRVHGTLLRLFRVFPFQEEANVFLHEENTFICHIIPSANPDEVMLTVLVGEPSRYVFRRLSFADDSGNPCIELGSRIELEDYAPGHDSQYVVRSVNWRNGLLFWATGEPRALTIAKEGESPPFPRIGLGALEDRAWGYAVNEDGTVLVARSGRSSFRVYSIEYPDVLLQAEYSLVYSKKTKQLSMRKLHVDENEASLDE